MLTPEQIIEWLHLEPLPVEGGFFRQTYRAHEIIEPAGLPERYPQPKSYGSAIYYLLHGNHFSALHRLLTDEIYHFYLGDPVEMLQLKPDGTGEHLILGPDIVAGQHLQVVVPRGVWQGSRVLPGGRIALMGTTMAPAWDPSDFELGIREELVCRYPDWTDLICALTRVEG